MYIIYVLTKKKIILKDLESVTGLVSFCSKAIPSARAFIRRFYYLIASVNNKKPHYFVGINKEAKKDVQVWLDFLEHFNGIYFIPDDCWFTLELYTDSSGNSQLGCGAYFRGRWAQFRWPCSWCDSDIMKNMSLLELIPIILALWIWSPELRNKKVSFYIDNQALVSIINKRKSKDKNIIKLIRSLVFLTMDNIIQFKALHIEGVNNNIADIISRFQMLCFRKLAPSVDELPAGIPEQFITVISDLLICSSVRS